MLNEPRKKTESSDENQLVDEKLSHLNSKDAKVVKKIIRDHSEVIVNLFDDVQPSTVTRSFELKSENPIYPR